MFQHGSLTLFRVRGIPVRAHWTLLLVLPYLAYVLSVDLRSMTELAGVTREELVLPPLVWGLILALGLFASIALHELAHSFLALRFGGRVRSITLMLVGGASQLARIPPRPRDEALMAAVGPATSLALGAVLYLAYGHSGAWPTDVQMGLFYLGAMNVTIGLFNLIPAFPMDGGRLLRAGLAMKLGRERATRIAGAVGRVCAIGLGVMGLWTGNLLLILIAVFVYSGAQGEEVSERVHGALEGLRIADLLPRVRRPPSTMATGELLGEVLPRMRELDRLELVVIDPAGAPVAVLQAGDLQAAAEAKRWAMTVGELAARLPVRHVVVPWTASANDAIDRASEAGAEYVIVIAPGAEPPSNLVGLLAAEDIARMVQLQALARQRGGPRDASASFAS
jgi:Zn-dependent protease/CBS domain-containing protein